ncbi:MAG: DinB family protein [Anaerolineaceae bacterium]|nr:DinB family protein [Anaerolineaceae bacterium]
MINMAEIIRQLGVNAEAMRTLVRTISDEQASWKPAPETWSLKQVMEHVYNEERIDFRKHLKEMLNNPPQAWGSGGPEEYLSVPSCGEALQGFLVEREASIAWLKELKLPDWGVTLQVPFGPAGDVMTLSSGDVLVSWVAHDYLHLRQINELLYARHEKQSSPNSVQYAGGW